MAKADAKFGPIFAKFAAMPVEEVAKDPQALKMGEPPVRLQLLGVPRLGRQGARGFPNLTDKDWRWGGEPDTIKTTIMAAATARCRPG
jgi:cytochrome c oxidase cbb3-type subunit 3